MIKKGDTVAVLVGKDRGKKGKVLRLFPKTNQILVEGLNRVKVFTRPSQQNPKGGIIEMEAKLNRSKVQLVCPRCAKQSRSSVQILKDGTKQRTCKKCHEII